MTPPNTTRHTHTQHEHGSLKVHCSRKTNSKCWNTRVVRDLLTSNQTHEQNFLVQFKNALVKSTICYGSVGGALTYERRADGGHQNGKFREVKKRLVVVLPSLNSDTTQRHAIQISGRDMVHTRNRRGWGGLTVGENTTRVGGRSLTIHHRDRAREGKKRETRSQLGLGYEESQGPVSSWP